jgi:hypothetical protein
MCSPTPPSPQNTIQQQTASNRETAITQAGLNMVDQTDAAGNTLAYTQNGTWADGTPRYQAKQSLGAAGQQLQATNQGTSQNIASLANEQSGRLSGLLNAPIDFTAQKDYLNSLTEGALNKSWDRQSQQFETDLVNRGIRPGSTAYNDSQNQFMTNRSDAYNSALVGNYNTALQSQLALRAQPLNEILALSGQSQVQSPQFASTPSTGVAGTDVAGITQAGYQNQNQQYGQQQSLLGGLFSAGANLLPLAFGASDIRLKTNLVRTGTHPIGVGIYDYDRIDTGVHERGVVAQELMAVAPDLVKPRGDGMLTVNYTALGMEPPNADG